MRLPDRPGGGGGGVQRRMSLYATEKPRDAWGVLARLGRLLRRHMIGLVVVLLTVIGSSALGLVSPGLTGKAIDSYILNHDLRGLGHIVVLMLLVYAGTAVTTWLQSFLMASVSQETVREMRQTLFTKLQALPVRFFDLRTTGELMSQFTNDMENVSSTLSDSITQLFSGVLRLVGAVVIMLVVNWRLALVSFVTIPLMSFIARWVATHTLAGYRAQQEALGDLNGMVEETITGARVVKAYACEERVIGEFDGINMRLQHAATRAMTFAMVLPPMVNMANNLGYALTAGAGGWMAVQGMASVGTIVAFMSYAQQFGRPLNQLANLFNTVQGALAGAERVFEVIDQKPEMIAPPDAVPVGRVRGDLAFQDVNFAYEPETPVLKDVNLHVSPGQTAALVGPTGAGKTTLVNVLSRFYDIDSGAIRVDDVDIRRLKKDDLRRQLGIVLQDSFLFSDSVLENIRYGRLDASDEEVTAAARMANADTFIRHLPDGYQTKLAERGSNLSQGQRQLLTVARALLANPAILILDEATSSVDTRTEQHIQEALGRLMKGRTNLVIAHRLSTIRNADVILVINDGRIIERGSHSELMERRGFYQNLYMSQFKGHAPPP
jgi:ATP-binding cassette subfamily B multidrug efflux pump